MSGLKIFFTLTPAFDPNGGGVQRTTFKLGKYFTEQGHSVFYYSLAKSGHILVEYGTLFSAPELGGGRRRANLAYLKDILLEIRPDIVINQMPYEEGLSRTLEIAKVEAAFLLLGCLRNSLFNFKTNAREVCRRTFPKWLFRIIDNRLGMGIIQTRHWLMHRRDLARILKRHDFFVLLAPQNRVELQYFLGERYSEKVISIPNSIPEVPNVDGDKEKVVLYVGRLNVEQKRCDLLVDFWHQAHVLLPDWKFIVVGDGSYKRRMEERARILGLPRIIFEGHRAPEPYYSRAALFVMPSAYEGFPNVLLEAQSHAVVPVAFNSYVSLPWIVNDAKDAVLVEPFNVSAMVQEVVRLACDPERRSEMAKAAQANAGRFVIEKVGRLWFEFFARQRLSNERQSA